MSCRCQYRSLTLGSQSVYEDRGWWWDDTLDLALLSVSSDRWFVHTGIGVQASHRLFGERFDEVIHGLGELTFQWQDQQTASVFLFGEFDQSERLQPGTLIDESLLDDRGNELYWLGIRGQGTIDRVVWPFVDYWIDLAHVGGQQTRYTQNADESDDDVVVVADSKRQDVDGWGLDLGMSMQTSLPARPRVSIGFATTFNGAGLNSETDRSYMLSAAESLRNIDLDSTFDGIDKHVGRAIDLNLLVEELDSWDIEVQFGLFQAGKAVVNDADATAYFGSVELSVDF